MLHLDFYIWHAKKEKKPKQIELTYVTNIAHFAEYIFNVIYWGYNEIYFYKILNFLFPAC